MSQKRENGVGTVPKQKKNGRWYRAMWLDNGKRKFIYGKSKVDVNRKFKEFLKEAENGIYSGVKKLSVNEYMSEWLTTYKKIDLKPKSYNTLESTLNHQIFPYFKGRQFFTLTHDIYKC